jgi:murein DD-endopeptidase MepM/ murein hydrolase activator NlpD
MSSLHQDRPRVARSAAATVAGSSKSKAPQIPTQRPGKVQRSEVSETPSVGGVAEATPARRTTRPRHAAPPAGAAALAARAKAAGAATSKAATKVAAKAAGSATTKVAVKAAGSATTKVATKVAATAASATKATKAAAAARAANRTPSRGAVAGKATPVAKTVPAAKTVPTAKAVAGATPRATTAVSKPTTGRTTTAKVAPSKAASSKAASSKAAIAPTAAATKSTAGTKVPAIKTTATRVPATKATAPKAVAAEQPAVLPVVAASAITEVQRPQVEATTVVAAIADTRPPGPARRGVAVARRRPALYLAAALVGAVGVGVLSAEGPAASANTTTASSSVSVAEQLGLTGRPEAPITAADTLRLQELAASRKERTDDQAAAAKAQEAADAAAAAAAAEAARPDAVLPVHGGRLTSGFGSRWGRLHAGIDLAAPMMTPEYSVMDGIVLEAGPSSGYGNAVYIQHHNGDVTVYGHMEKILVQPGQVVRAGETIALLGNRGRSTGPHLHFEVHVGGLNGKKVDPIPWLRARGIDI